MAASACTSLGCVAVRSGVLVGVAGRARGVGCPAKRWLNELEACRSCPVYKGDNRFGRVLV